MPGQKKKRNLYNKYKNQLRGVRSGGKDESGWTKKNPSNTSNFQNNQTNPQKSQANANQSRPSKKSKAPKDIQRIEDIMRGNFKMSDSMRQSQYEDDFHREARHERDQRYKEKLMKLSQLYSDSDDPL